MIPTKNQPSSNHDDVNLIGLDPPLTSSKLHIPLINDSDPHMQKFSDFKFDEMVSVSFDSNIFDR